MSEHDKLAEAREALERITDYFDQRADAEAVGDPARYQGNREMYLRRDAETVAAALAAARAQGAAEAYAEAAEMMHAASAEQVKAGDDHGAVVLTAGALVIESHAQLKALAREAAKEDRS